ncbi:FCRL2 protein, partial [Motacilla alba]|nr:FCRL2 protein [Motacilla alba]
LQLHHSGCYRCGGWVKSGPSPWWEKSAAVTVTVTKIGMLKLKASGGQVALGDHLMLRCAVATGTDPLSFSWPMGCLGKPLGTVPHLELPHTGNTDSSQYQCGDSNRDSVVES